MAAPSRNDSGRFAPTSAPTADRARFRAALRAVLAARKAALAPGPRTLRDVGTAAGFGASTWACKMSGRRPLTVADVEAVARALGCDVAALT